MNDTFHVGSGQNMVEPASTIWVLALGKTWFYFSDCEALFRGWQSLGGTMYAIVRGELRRLAA